LVVSYRRFGTTYRAYIQGACRPPVLPVNTGRVGCPETSVINYLRYVTSKKGEDLIFIAAEAINHEIYSCYLMSDV
jgi:hypothetical protein